MPGTEARQERLARLGRLIDGVLTGRPRLLRCGPGANGALCTGLVGAETQVVPFYTLRQSRIARWTRALHLGQPDRLDQMSSASGEI